MLTQHLGDSSDALKQLASGQHAFSKKLAAAKRPMLIVGSEQLKRDDGAAILSLVQQIAHQAATKSGVSFSQDIFFVQLVTLMYIILGY